MTPTEPAPRTLAPPVSSAAGRPALPTTPWVALPYADVARLDADSLRPLWPRLHAGQARPVPANDALIEGWALYHSGEFEQAAAVGLRNGAEGYALTHQATAIYANYLEPREVVRLALFRQVAERATQQAESEPDDCQALYWQAYALGRYSQAISVARALAQGLGSRVKEALERVIALQPQHADAHIALAAFHAEVIDKVGPLVGRMTYGVRADSAVALFERGLELNPNSASALMEYARGLVMLHGEDCMSRATALYEQAAALTPGDARERLDQELARQGLTE